MTDGGAQMTDGGAQMTDGGVFDLKQSTEIPNLGIEPNKLHIALMNAHSSHGFNNSSSWD